MAEEEEPAQSLEAYIASVKAMKDSEHYLTVTRLSYCRSAPQPLYLEPWGDVIQMPGPGEYDIVVHAPVAHAKVREGDRLTIEVTEDDVAIWIPSVIDGFAVFHDGAMIWHS